MNSRFMQSPFWTIHLYMCDGGIVRNLDVKAMAIIMMELTWK